MTTSNRPGGPLESDARPITNSSTESSTAARTPRYRSPEWRALPPGDPRRVRAILRAADAWATYVEAELATVTRDLLLDGDIDGALLAHRLKRAALDIREGWRPSEGPTYAELQRRRGTVRGEPCPRDCRRCSACPLPRAGDYLGRRAA